MIALAAAGRAGEDKPAREPDERSDPAVSTQHNKTARKRRRIRNKRLRHLGKDRRSWRIK